MNRSALLTAFAEVGVIAVLRAPSGQAAIAAIDALVEGGVTGIEVTFSTPSAPDIIMETARRHGPAVLLGAGTVRDGEQARAAADAGAAFLVSPGLDDDLAAAMRATGAGAVFGALTPTEVMRATALEADTVKIFPASLGGPAYLSSLRGPFPDIPLMPTGGVNVGNVGAWLAAGAIAVGAGSELCPTARLRAGDWPAITARARQFAAALGAYRRNTP